MFFVRATNFGHVTPRSEIYLLISESFWASGLATEFSFLNFLHLKKIFFNILGFISHILPSKGLDKRTLLKAMLEWGTGKGDEKQNEKKKSNKETNKMT